jgi:hypothetical protein
MDQPKSLPSIARVTFIVHFIVAIIVGLPLLIIPATFGGWFGYPSTPALEPPIRAFGAALLGLGAVTSLYGILTKNWERVDYIVRGEITYLALAIIVFVVSVVTGSGPILGNVAFAVVSVALLVLFVATWVARPK